MSEHLTCREFVEFLDDYLARSQSAAVRAAFDTHMLKCPECRCFLESYAETVRLAGSLCDDPEGPVPTDVPARLVGAILAARRAADG